MVDAVHHLVVTGSDYLTSVDILCASSATVSCGSSVWNATSVILLPFFRSFTADWTFLIPAASPSVRPSARPRFKISFAS